MRKEIDIEKKNAVAVHFRNGLGNFLMMTPAIQALAKYYNAEVDIVLDRSWQDSRRQSVEDFCREWELIREVKEFQDGFDARDYKQLFYARHGENCEAMSYFQDTAGYDAEHINWRASKINEVDYYMNQVYSLGYKGKVPDMYCVPGEGIRLQNFPELSGGNSYFRIGFCNGLFAGSKWNWERKGWPYFPELADLLLGYFPRTKLMLFGKGEIEAKWAKEMEGKGENVFNLVNVGCIRTTAKYLRRLHLFITTDTGLMHMADAFKVPMIVLFGPTLVSKNGPYNGEYRIARSPLRCAPCQQSPLFHTCKDWRCMRELKPQMVMSVIRKYLFELINKNHPYTRDNSTGEIREYLLR